MTRRDPHHPVLLVVQDFVLVSHNPARHILHRVPYPAIFPAPPGQPPPPPREGSAKGGGGNGRRRLLPFPALRLPTSFLPSLTGQQGEDGNKGEPHLRVQDRDTARFLLVLIQRRRHLGANAPPAACWVTRSFATSRYAGRGRAEGPPEPASGRKAVKGGGGGRPRKFRSRSSFGQLLSRLPFPQQSSSPGPLLSQLVAADPRGLT